MLLRRTVCGLHQQSIAYSSATFAATLMHSVFMTYYVKIYLTRFHVHALWFNVAQIVYMVWNAINDPLFGYIQDNCSFIWVKSRRHSILYGAPLFAVSFALTWFPWTDYSEPTWISGLQLTFSLCFYDTMYTFVVLAQSALFTEMSTLQEDRIQLVKYSQVASLLGSSAVFFTGLASDNSEIYPSFILCCCVISVLALVSMLYTGRNAFTMYDPEYLEGQMMESSKQDIVQPRESTDQSLLKQIVQIFSHRSFVVFVIINLLQIFQRTFLSNFAIIICGHLFPENVMSSWMKSIFYGSLHTLPQVAVIFGTVIPFVSSIGYYKIMKYSFIFKMIMGIGLFIVGKHWWAVVAFFVIESVESNAIFHLFTLCVSDIIDLDKVKYKRKHEISSMIYGTNALVTKPAQSLAPMITVAILNQYFYDKFKETSSSASEVNSEEYQVMQNAMFTVTCIVPIVTGFIQFIVWFFYTIKDSHLQNSKKIKSS